jgi:uncharacterized delta-60 repeat protein
MSHFITKLFILGAILFWGTVANILAVSGSLDTSFNGTGKSVFNIEDAPAPGSFADVVVIAGNKFLVTGHVITNGEYKAVTLSRYNPDGSLDLSFGTGGKVITDTGVSTESKALAVQPDGKIVVIGAYGINLHSTVVVRYTADGALDTSFGTNGIFFSVLLGPRDIAIAADNKIYIAGSSGLFSSPNWGVQLARINANGTADTSFGNNGVASISSSETYTDQMVIQPDGKIVVTAKSYQNSVLTGLIVRFNTDGSPDSGFGEGGRRRFGGFGSGDIFMGGVALQPDGKIVLAGYARTPFQSFGDSSLMLARLNPDGSSDASFSGGIVYHNLSADMDRATDIALQSDGKILISGTRADSNAIAARFDSTGAFDASFGTGGVVLLPTARNATAIALQGSDIVVVGDDYSRVHVLARLNQTGTILSYTNESFIIGRNDFAQDVAIQSDGKIVTAGFSSSPAGIPVIAVARLLPNGNLDPAFGTGGKVVFNEGNTYSQAFAVKIQPDGKIVVVGRLSSQGYFVSYSLYVVRLDVDGSPDNTFGTGGKAIINYNAVTGLIGYDLEFQPDGKIVVGGAHLREGNEGMTEIDMMAARLNPNGTPDGGFANGGIFTHPTGYGLGPREQANALSIQPDGKIILAGTHLLRLTSNGTIDAAFSATPVPLDFPATIALQSDGKMLLSGSKNTDLAIARHSSNASIDPSFGINGVAALDFGGADNANALYLDPNGDIVAGGSTLGGSPSRRKFALARFKPNGTPDQSFGTGGKVVTDFGGGAEIFGIARQSDGKIVAAGSAKINIDHDFALARYSSLNTQFDFDGDGKSDFSIYRPEFGEWWYLRSSDGGNRAFQFGTSSDKITPADYTGDGKTDVAFFRPATGQWFILRSEDFSYYAFPFGIAEDIPAPADYDGDGKADAAVYRPSTSVWYVLRSTGGTAVHQYGASGDAPVPADYDGDGQADYALYNNSTKTWKVRTAGSESASSFSGAATNRAVPGDYTGDGKTDMAFYDTAGGTWFVVRSENRTYYAVQFGIAGAVPAPADYDGDGKTDLAIYQPSTGEWWYQASSANGEARVRQFGVSSDLPVPAAYIP